MVQHAIYQRKTRGKICDVESLLAKLYFLMRERVQVRTPHEHSNFSLVFIFPSVQFGFPYWYLFAMADSAALMYALATVLSILAIIAILLRFYARRIKQTALSWDDYVILLALVRQDQILHNSSSNTVMEKLM